MAAYVEKREVHIHCRRKGLGKDERMLFRAQIEKLAFNEEGMHSVPGTVPSTDGKRAVSTCHGDYERLG